MAFKRGNIVKIKKGFHTSEDPEIGKLAVIEYSYGEKYGSGEIYGGYSILFKEDGSGSAWWNEENLEFVSEGGEDEIKKCKELWKLTKEKETDLEYIKEQILENKYSISSISILKLFDEIKFESSFKRNGEYYALFSEWKILYPIFEYTFNKEYDKLITYISENRKEFKDNIIDFYNRINRKEDNLND